MAGMRWTASLPALVSLRGSDKVAPMTAIERIREAFGRLADAKVYVYPGAGHGFMTMTRGHGYIESGPAPPGLGRLKCSEAFRHDAGKRCHEPLPL